LVRRSRSRDYLGGTITISMVISRYAVGLEASFGRRVVEVDRSAAVGCNLRVYLWPEQFERPGLSWLQLRKHLGEVIGLPEEYEVTAQPQFNKADDTSNHSLFPLSCRWYIYFDLVFKVVRVDPDKDLIFPVVEDHIFVDHKKPIDRGKFDAGCDDCTSIPEGPLVRIQFLQLRKRGL
jgi:hypothetical protein